MGGSKMDIKTNVSSGKMAPLKMGLFALAAVGVVLVPIVFQGMGQIFLVRIMAVIGLYVMLALGLNIVVGYAGLLDLGYIAFYAMGAYVGVLSADLISRVAPVLAPYSYFISLPIAALAAAATGLALGTPVLRLRGDYLAIVTLGFGEIVRIIITNDIGGLTNGAAGLPRAGQMIPSPFGLYWLKDHATFQALCLDFSFSNNLYWYFIIVLLCCLTVFVIRRLNDSRLGRSWVAMRADEVAAASVGINITVAKLWAFSLGALWGGVAGVTFANFQQFVSPESFTFMESVFIVCIIVLGGMGSIPGAILGAIIIQGVPELIRALANSGILKLSPEQASLIGNYRFLVFGLLMVIMMAYRPQGFLPSKRRAMELRPEDEKILAEENQSLYDTEHQTETSDHDL